jgi:hypothetical protein
MLEDFGLGALSLTLSAVLTAMLLLPLLLFAN